MGWDGMGQTGQIRGHPWIRTMQMLVCTRVRPGSRQTHARLQYPQGLITAVFADGANKGLFRSS